MVQLSSIAKKVAQMFIKIAVVSVFAFGLTIIGAYTFVSGADLFPTKQVSVPTHVTSHPMLPTLSTKLRKAMEQTYRSWDAVNEEQVLKASGCVSNRFGEFVYDQSASTISDLARDQRLLIAFTRTHVDRLGALITECAKINSMPLPTSGKWFGRQWR
jgi:hypothetical protein